MAQLHELFFGLSARYGVSQRKLALFRAGKALYERIEENGWSKLDMEIHEHPFVEGSVGEIRAPIEHNDFRGIEKFLDRHRDYALWETRRVLLLERQGKISNRELTGRQRFKYANLERWWYPWFISSMLISVKLGFLDGAAGFGVYLLQSMVLLHNSIDDPGATRWQQRDEGRSAAMTLD